MPNTFLKILLLSATLNSAILAETYVVMSGTKATVKEKIDLNDLREIYMGHRIFWTDGERIYPSHIDKESSSMNIFLNQVLSMNPRQFNKYWRRRLFSGKGHPPKEIENDRQALDYVRKTKGSIAIVSRLPSRPLKNIFYFKPQKDYQTLKRIAFNSNKNRD